MKIINKTGDRKCNILIIYLPKPGINANISVLCMPENMVEYTRILIFSFNYMKRLVTEERIA